MNWREFPMARLLLPLILGILIGNFWGIGRIDIFWLLLPLFCMLTLAAMQSSIPYKHRWWYGITLNLFLLIAGCFICTQNQTQTSVSIGERLVVGEIVQINPGINKHRIFLHTYDSENTNYREGKILVYVDKSTKSDSLRIGDHLLCKGRLSTIPPPLNPHAFDYNAYMSVQGVSHQTFITDDNWLYLGYRNSIYRVADSWRSYFLSILKTYLPGANEYAVGAALSLGYKSAITEEIRAAYAQTGAMHVLAVSGLHVGLVQLMISWLLARVHFQSKYWRFLKTIITIIGIWSFALLAGGAPSVLRAATMFSFLAIGLAIHRFTNIYNTLASSAFLLLCIQPSLLFDIGFQLSYSAVLGIVYFQPKLYRLWYIRYKIGDYIWQLTTVSIAAQLATLPISIYYFHQFPVYFFLSGLIVVPAAALILILSISLFAFYHIPILPDIIGYLLNVILKVINNLIFLIQQLPAGLLKGIWISSTSVMMMYVSLLLVIVSINTKRYIYLQYALVGGLLLSLTHAYRQWEVTQQQAAVIYHIRGKTLVDYFDGQNCHSLTTDSLSGNDIKYAAQQHRWYRRIQSLNSVKEDSLLKENLIWKHGDFVQMGELRLIMPHETPPSHADSIPPLEVDILLLTGNANIDLEKWSTYLRPQQVVIDGSASYYKAKAWKKSCERLAWPIHYTRYDGALIINHSNS